jgi:hypothetical protein
VAPAGGASGWAARERREALADLASTMIFPLFKSFRNLNSFDSNSNLNFERLIHKGKYKGHINIIKICNDMNAINTFVYLKI